MDALLDVCATFTEVLSVDRDVAHGVLGVRRKYELALLVAMAVCE